MLLVYTKSTMKKPSGRVVSVNILGLLGYMSLLLAWFLFIAVFFVLLANSSFMTMPGSQPVDHAATIPDSFSGMAMFASYGVAVVALVVTIIIFVTLPYFMSKGISKFIRRGLGWLRVTETKWHIWQAKALIATIPVIGLGILTLAGMRGDTTMIIYTATFFAALLALCLFSFQYFLAWRLKVASKDIW